MLGLMNRFRLLLVPALLSFAPLFAAERRLGFIGSDTSHATAFTRVLNDASSPDHIPGATVVAAFKGGSPDIEESAKRVDKYADELKTKYKVEFVGTITDLCSKVDGLLLESVDGRPHLPQFKEAVRCVKPVFIDKLFVSMLAEAEDFARLSLEGGGGGGGGAARRF